MIDRKLILMGALLVGIGAGIPLVAQDTPDHAQHGKAGPELQQAIDDASACFAICEQTIAHCLEKGGKHVEPAHLKLLIDCAEICRTNVGFMARQSELHTDLCRLCAETCRQCAESCAKLPDDPLMQACADACRKCAESCEKVAGPAKGS